MQKYKLVKRIYFVERHKGDPCGAFLKENTIVNNCLMFTILLQHFTKYLSAAAVAQSVRALAPQAEGWVFESQPRQT